MRDGESSVFSKFIIHVFRQTLHKFSVSQRYVSHSGMPLSSGDPLVLRLVIDEVLRKLLKKMSPCLLSDPKSALALEKSFSVLKVHVKAHDCSWLLKLKNCDMASRAEIHLIV